MKSFFDPSPSLLTPTDMVTTFTRSRVEDLSLPSRVVIVVDPGNLNLLVRKTGASRIASWRPYRTIFKVPDRDTAIVRSAFGSANMAVLTEELSCFGVREICLWGYCGGIDPMLPVGSRILASQALREEGASYHYLQDEERHISSHWLDTWRTLCASNGFVEGTIWTCDAPYRETAGKVAKYAGSGVLGVEMEVASLYAVCAYHGLHGIAFLVVSDLFRDRRWIPGFFSSEFKKSVQSTAAFILENVL